MNKKNFITLILLMSFLAPVANAGIMEQYDKAKSKLQEIDSKVTAVRETPAKQKSQLQSQKAAALKSINTKIAAKKAEIASVEKSTTMFETEKKLKLKLLNRELTSLQNEYKDTVNFYNKQINTLK